VVTSDGGVLGTVRALAGRAIPALPSDDPAAIGALLAACPVEVDLPFPSLEPGRSLARAALLEAGIATEHHPVEVDPRPAFDELVADAGSASIAQLAAAAAGVLAGRVAAGVRRWRSL
jgi:hypothetical protein